MKDPESTMPPADQPKWGEESFDYFGWFKFHHLKTLEKYHKLIRKQHEGIPPGTGYPPGEVKLLLGYLDELIKLYDWLPDTAGGTESMDTVIKYRNKFEESYLNQDIDEGSYWLAQEVDLEVSTMYNYMEAICED